MSNPINAAEQLRNFVNKIKPILEAGEYLDGLGDLQQAESEAKARAQTARNAADSAVKEREAKEAELSSVEKKITEAEQRAVRIAERADGAAKVLISGAEKEAAEIIADAESRRSKVEQEIAGHQVTLKSVQTRVESANAELARLQEAISQTKAKIAGL